MNYPNHGTMFFSVVFLVLLAYFNSASLAVRHEPHLHPEVKVVGYEGPLTADMFQLFRSAEIMELIDCNLTLVESHVFSNLPKLKKLIHVNLNVTNVHSNASLGQSSLEEYHFIRVNWDEAYLEIFNHYENLKIFILSEDPSGNFVEIKANPLNRTKLEYLEISKSGVEKIDDAAFNNLNRLETLILSGNKLKGLSKETLVPLKKLKVLNLSGNLIESFDASQIPNLENLEKIDLSKNPLKSVTLEGIEKFAPNLKEIKLSDTFLPDGEKEKLQKNAKVNILL